jgi:hypothetical protein
MTAPPPQAPISRPGVVTATSAARSPRSAARAPVLSVDYRYLRRDLTYLSVLAPLMIVLLIVAFFVFH